MIFSSKQHAAVHFNLLMLFCFLLPLHPRLTTLVGIFLGLNWLMSGTWFSNAKAFINPLFLLLISFYILHLLGMVHTVNVPQGWQELETKFSLLFFPLLFFSFPIKNRIEFDTLLKVFTGGCLVASLYCLILGGYDYYLNIEIFYKCLCHSYLGKYLGFHPTYFGIYIGFALFFLQDYFIKNIERYSSIQKVGHWILSIWFFLFIMLLASRIIVYATSFILVISFFCFMKNWKDYIKGVAISLLGIFLLGYMIKEFPCIGKRANREIIISGKENRNARIILWTTALDIIKNQPFIGVGTGDAQDELRKEFAKVNYTIGLKNNHDAHNQYLHTTVSVGILGGIIVIIMLCIPFFFAFQKQDYLYLILLALLGISFLTESILEVQRGTLFYGFFNSLFASSLFCFSKQKKKTPQNEVNHFEGLKS